MNSNTFNKLYALYYRKSLAFVRSYVHDDWASEDITSEALIRLWERLQQGDVEENHVLPLLLTILRNKSLDYLKHEEVERSALEKIAAWKRQEIEQRIIALEACNPDEIFSEEVKEIILRTLAGLSAETQQIFTMSRYKNMTNKDIAEAKGISVKTVEYHISKALKTFRHELKDYLPILLFWLN